MEVLSSIQYVSLASADQAFSEYGPTKSLEEAAEFAHTLLPSTSGENTQYTISYAVHRRVERNVSATEGVGAGQAANDYEVIGIVKLKPGMTVPLQDNITRRTDPESGFLRLEIGYLFLPIAWGKGYATESCRAVIEACERSRSHFTPFTSLYIEGVVGPGNPASMKVLEKAGLKQVGLNKWDGPAIWLAGAMRPPEVWVYGTLAF